MTPGRGLRRIAVRAAGVAVAAPALMLGAGCHGVPLARVAPVPNRPQPALGPVGRALGAATVALDVPSETAAIDPSNSARGTVTPVAAIERGPRVDLIAAGAAPRPTAPAATPDPTPPAATPLLDEALDRARRRVEVPDPVSLAVLTPSVDPIATPAPIPNLAPAPVEPPAEAVPTPPPAVAPAPAVEPVPVPVPPEEAWREGVRKLVGLARARQEQAGGGGGTEPWGLRARVLAWLAEPDIDPDLGQRDADAVRAVLRALQANAAPNAAADVPGRGDDVRTAVRTLEAKAPLELTDLQLCSQVDGFGDYAAFEPPVRRAGDWVIVYCEVDGVHHEPVPGGFQTRIAGGMEIIPEGGGRPVAEPFGTADVVAHRRRRDYFINYSKRLPANLPPGRYTVRVTLRDALGDRTASRGVPLVIVDGRDPATEPAAGVAATPPPAP